MKCLQILIVSAFVFISRDMKAQNWSAFLDSAASSWNSKKVPEAIDYYKKALEYLKADSAGTSTYGTTLFKLGVVYENTGRYALAEPCYAEAMQLYEKVFGKNSGEYGKVCNNLAWVYNAMGQYAKGEPLYLEAKRATETALGKESGQYINICDNLGWLYKNMGKFSKSEEVLLEAKQIILRTKGSDSKEMASNCSSLGSLYRSMGLFEKSEEENVKAKMLREKIFGRESLEFAHGSNNLGNLYQAMGKYDMALNEHLEAKRIRGKLLGTTHPDYATSCNNLGTAYASFKRHKDAYDSYSEAREIRQLRLGKNHPMYASVCGNLGSACIEMGDLEKAETFLMEANSIIEAIANRTATHAASCHNLGILYQTFGQFRKAEHYFLESQKIREAVFTRDHVEFAIGQANLAAVYMRLNEEEKSKQLYLDLKDFFEKKSLKTHPFYSTVLISLGISTLRLNEFSDAALYLLSGKSVLEAADTPDSMVYARCLLGLGEVYAKTNNAAAPQFIQQAIQIFERIKGKENREYIQSCLLLGDYYRNNDDPIKAGLHYGEASASERKWVSSFFHFANESEQLAFINNTTNSSEIYYSFYLENNSPVHAGKAMDLSLSQRHQVLMASKGLQEAIFLTIGDSATRGKYTEWIRTREQLAAWYTSTVKERDVYVKTLEEKSEKLEKDLIRSAIQLKSRHESSRINWQDIKSSIRQDEAVVEFAEFRYYDGMRNTDSLYYVALVLRKDDDTPAMIPLFEKRSYDSLAGFYKEGIGQHQVNFFYGAEKNGLKIYDLLWKPLEKKLEKIKTVYFSPAGSLFKISFAALPFSKQGVLSDRYKLVQLNTTADVKSPAISILPEDKIVLYGGVVYDADSTSISRAVAGFQKPLIASRSLPLEMTLSGSDAFKFMDGTHTEIKAISRLAGQRMYQAKMLDSISATEESFKSFTGKESPGVLHIATHGFFFPDAASTISTYRRENIHAFIHSENPLIRSGLVLSGANNAWRGKPVKGFEDGILTAYEVSNMYLPNTKLAVLSACETGLGDIRGSEGVYGLQRAFKMAGVENLVMSLWKVPDQETAAFMQLFYENLFQKQSIQDAFYRAQTAMKNKYRNDPYKWAAWVLIR